MGKGFPCARFIGQVSNCLLIYKVGFTSMLNRRQFLKWSLAGGAALASAQSWAQSQPAERRLKFYNTHTGEQLAATYWADGQYLSGELAAIDRRPREPRRGRGVPG